MTKAPKKRQRPMATGPADAPAAAAPANQSARQAVQGANAAKPQTATPVRDSAPKRAKLVKALKKRKRRAPAVELARVEAAGGYEDRLARLARAVQAVRAGEQTSPRTAKLLAGGVPKMAQKLMEEAAETAIDAVRTERTAFVNESADLLYNLVVLWNALEVTPDEVWAEMDRREALLGMAEKLPKADEPGE